AVEGRRAGAWNGGMEADRRRAARAQAARGIGTHADRRGSSGRGRSAVRAPGALPDLSPTGAFYPFRMRVAPMASGTRLTEDEAIWGFISQSMRKTLALETGSAALAELAHRQWQHRLNVVVMKGVMDFADHGRNDHFKEFAARAAAECLLWFLCKALATTAT